MQMTDAELSANLNALDREWHDLHPDDQVACAVEAFGAAGEQIAELFRALTAHRAMQMKTQFPNSLVRFVDRARELTTTNG